MIHPGCMQKGESSATPTQKVKIGFSTKPGARMLLMMMSYITYSVTKHDLHDESPRRPAVTHSVVGVCARQKAPPSWGEALGRMVSLRRVTREAFCLPFRGGEKVVDTNHRLWNSWPCTDG